jgi:hypothetical protein
MGASADKQLVDGKGRAQLWALFSLIVYTPLPLASDRPWALVLLALLTGILLLWNVWAPCGRSMSQAWFTARVPFVLLSLWMLLLAVQLLPMPQQWISSLGGYAADGFGMGVAVSQPITVDLYSTKLYLTEACVLSMLFWLVIRLVDSRSRVEQLARVIVFSGLLQALIGVLLMSTGTTFQLFFSPMQDPRAHGSFVSPNNFAGYLELTLSIGIGLMIAKLDGRHSANWRHRLHGWMSLIISEKAILRLSLIIMVVGLVASRSRMGNSAFFVSLLIAGVFAVILMKYIAGNIKDKRAIDKTHSMIMFIASLIVLDVVIIGGVVGVEKVVERIEYTNLRTQELEVQSRDTPAESGDVKTRATGITKHNAEESLEHRSEVARASLPIIRDYPWVGTGGGTFKFVFFHYRPSEITGYWDHTHNDLIEICTDAGLLGLLLLGALVVHSTTRSIGLLTRSADQMARGIGFAGLMGVVAFVMHGMVDFNFQNPADAMLFMILLSFPYLMPISTKK